jgi:hypothetical protein
MNGDAAASPFFQVNKDCGVSLKTTLVGQTPSTYKVSMAMNGG